MKDEGKEKWISAQDLPALDPLMEQAENAIKARHVSLDDYLKLFDPAVQGKIRGSALAEGVTHLVCFENIDMWSSMCGHRTSLAVGDKQTYTLEKVLKRAYARLGDVPSRFQYPVAYASVVPLQKELPKQESHVVGGNDGYTNDVIDTEDPIDLDSTG